MKFSEFIDKQERETKKQLKILEQILKKDGLDVKDHLDEEDPFLFIYNPKKNTFFDGIRLYKIGDQIAFRIQKEEKTEPFGKAYSMDIEDMFHDLLSEYKPEEAGKKIMKAVMNEVKKFFEKSAKAEDYLREKNSQREPWSKVVVKSSDFNVDFSNLTYMRT